MQVLLLQEAEGVFLTLLIPAYWLKSLWHHVPQVTLVTIHNDVKFVKVNIMFLKINIFFVHILKLKHRAFNPIRPVK